MSNSGSSKSKLGTLQTLNVLTGAECAYLLSVGMDYPTSVPGVVSAINTLVQATMKGDFPMDGFALNDREGELLKFHEKRFFQGWSPRKFALQGTTLEYRKVSKKATKVEDLRLINLTPECFVVETGLSAAEKKHGFILVTPNKVLQLACPSFGEKLCWVGSLARAILVPRQKVLGLTQTSLFRGVLALDGGAGQVDAEVAAKINGLGIVASDLVKLSGGKEKGGKRFVALQSRFIQLWKDESSYTSGKRPVGYIFLDHSMKISQRSETSLELVSTLDGGKPTFLDFASADKFKTWKAYLEGSVILLRASLKTYLTFFKEGVPMKQPPRVRTPSPRPAPIPPSPPKLAAAIVEEKKEEVHPTTEPSVQKAVEEPKIEAVPEPVPEKVEPTVEPQPVPGTVEPVPAAAVVASSVEAKPVNVAVTEEELDPRPVVELRLRRLDANGSAVNPTQEQETFAKIHVNLNDPLVCVRDEIYSQVDPDKIPTHFSFVRFADELRTQLMTSSLKDGVALTLSQEEEVTVDKCLIENKYVLLSCPDELIRRCTSEEDWERERKAYQQQIRHLEAQLAEARRALHDKAKSLKRSDESHEQRSHLFTALCALQRDGFLDSTLDVDDMEIKYLTFFHEEDALKAFAFSPNCPLRVVWRRLCAEPERMRKYIEDLETFVLKKYRIRRERLGAPFWSMNVLRDTRFVEDSKRFEDWAKTEPWCEDDAERYVYLTGKLFYVSESSEEFTILSKGRPTEPPQRSKPAQQEGTPSAREAFKKDRPLSFMASADAQAAMKQFQSRKSKSARAVPTKILEGSMFTDGQEKTGTAPAVPAAKPDEATMSARPDDVEESKSPETVKQSDA